MKNLHKLRKQRCLTQTELAKKLGIKPNTISQYELGKRSPGLRRINEIAKILECSVLDLLDDD